ncbi:SDR family oxidoreductase [Paractinoplanes atraurantiacus]|uniref:Nucleoside-diphosphate-sugar epimerase n=1 Tax=Paractinoplanes atraurantiacus TaxID=1036182 RepID=A0A285ID14_9ACTN|nr:SDR family oxidoreductase [Actinoplanes atraurantiacus]SNY45869.1 Nucleoside-diphosphate-sugar epimerase [Actinoplanes atraurantiacus]
MRIFVTGASGWTGSAVVPELVAAGHQVVGLARSDASAAALAAAGVQVLRGDIDDLGALRAGASDADGVVHLAFKHDFTNYEQNILDDRRAVETMGAVLEGTGKPLVITAGTPVVPGALATELDTLKSADGRGLTATIAAGMAERGVRSSVVNLPRTVHGPGDKGFIAMLVAAARQSGVAGYVGDGSQRWPAVHRLDAARLFRLAVEDAPAGSILNAVGDEGVRIADVAAIIGRHLDLPVKPRPAEEFGFLGMVLAVDQPASGAATRDLLGWAPRHPSLIEDLEEGHYTEG